MPAPQYPSPPVSPTRSYSIAELAEEFAFRRDDAERNFGLVIGERLERRKCRPQQGQHKSAQEGADDRQAESDGYQIEKPAL
mgnify:CR=1 FL=1